MNMTPRTRLVALVVLLVLLLIAAQYILQEIRPRPGPDAPPSPTAPAIEEGQATFEAGTCQLAPISYAPGPSPGFLEAATKYSRPASVSMKIMAFIPGPPSSFIETASESDYAKNIQTTIDSKPNIVVTVGFLLAKDTAEAAAKNTGVKWIGIDQFQPGALAA